MDGEPFRLHHGPDLARLLDGSVCDIAEKDAARAPLPGVRASHFLRTHGCHCDFVWC